MSILTVSKSWRSCICHFASSLTDNMVSENVYAHAVNVCQRFSIWTLVEYSNLYLKTDVLLLYCRRFLKISATIASWIMGSTPHIIITPYRTSCEMSGCKTHGCKIWTANRHWHDHVYRAWYTRWFESVFEQLCVSQQYAYRHKIESVLMY